MSTEAKDLTKTEVVTKWEAAKTRAANLAKRVGGTGIKASAMAAGTGAAAFYVGRSIADVAALQGNYRKGLAFAAIGHVVKKKSHDVGTALVAVGGYLLAQDYQAQKDADAKTAGTATAQVAATPAKGFGLDDVSGFVDAAAGLVGLD